MCGQPERAPRCRSKQLFDAAENIIDRAREVAQLKVSQSYQDLARLEVALDRMGEAVAIFDRLNRGL